MLGKGKGICRWQGGSSLSKFGVHERECLPTHSSPLLPRKGKHASLKQKPSLVIRNYATREPRASNQSYRSSYTRMCTSTSNQRSSKDFHKTSSRCRADVAQPFLSMTLRANRMRLPSPARLTSIHPTKRASRIPLTHHRLRLPYYHPAHFH